MRALTNNGNICRVMLVAFLVMACGSSPVLAQAEIGQTQSSQALDSQAEAPRPDSRTTTVTRRPRPELDALGVQAGGFTIAPSVDIGETYNDNIFAAEAGTRDDFITIVSPAVRIESDWNRHALAIKGSSDIVRHASNSAEDHETYRLSADGRLDILRDTNLTAGIGFEKGSEARGSVDDVAGLKPTEFSVLSLAAGLFNRWNRVSMNVGGSLRRRDYDDVPVTGGTVNNDDRDRDEFKLDLRAGYEIQSEYEAFVQFILTSVDYEDAVDDNGLNRDNDGFEIRAGARIDLTALLFGDVFIGYLNRDYEAATLKSVETGVAGIDLTWNMTRLTTIKGGVSRGVSETTLTTASGVVSTGARVSADHELLRNLILSARLSRSQDAFEGSSREDDYFHAGIGAKYLLNRYFSLSLDYDYANRDSSASGADYDINKIMLRLRGQL